MNSDERRRKLAAEQARQDLQETIADLHDHGLNMGEISVLVLDQLVLYFEGINEIRRMVNGTE